MSFARVPEIVLAQPMHDDVVDERAFGIQHRRIVRLANRQLRGIVHGDVLDRCERATRMFAASQPDIAHMTDVKQPNTAADSLMFRDQAAARWILDGHIPAAKIHHFRP
jgi:hypothetical protein